MTPQIDSTYTVPAGNMVVQGSTTILIATFYHDALSVAFPFVIPCLILIVVDLIFGISASKRRGEEVRTSRAIRRTMDKLVSYTCWVVLASTLAVAFDFPILSKIILGIVMGVEMLSVIANYFTMRGKKITGLWETVMKVVGKKIDTDLSDIKIEEDENVQELHTR